VQVTAADMEVPLGDEVREMAENAKQMGKLKFFPLCFDLRTEEWFDDVFMLIDFRKMLK